MVAWGVDPDHLIDSPMAAAFANRGYEPWPPLGGAAPWPLAAGAQQGDRMRRIGVLMPYDENDPLGKTAASAFTQALEGLGWTNGRNPRMDFGGTAMEDSGYRELLSPPSKQTFVPLLKIEQCRFVPV